jgi:DNA-binding NarL/FixJ family response regulator
MQAKKTILLVDDHPIVRTGLRLSLESSPAFAVCGEADDGSSALQQAKALRPDLIVLDLLLQETDGFNLIGQIKDAHPDAAILIYSVLDEMVYAQRCLQAGAQGYIMKSEPLAQVIAALETLTRDNYYVSPAVQRSVLAGIARQKKAGAHDPIDSLSNRELEVFRLLGTGVGTAQIASRLNLSAKTVGSFRERLKNKLNLHSARELERLAEIFVRTGSFHEE